MSASLPPPVESVWHDRRGELFHVQGWTAEGEGPVVLVHHGLGEHIGRYEVFARRLLPRGVSVWGYDARGHGRSGGKRGHVDGLSQLAEDLEALIPVLLERSGRSEAVLFGHSMGAAAVLWYLTTREPHPAIRKLLISAPPVHVPRTPMMRAQLALARVMRRLRPSLTLPSGLPPEQVSSVAEEVRRYQSDPLIHDRISAALGWSLLVDAPRVLEHAHHIRLPSLIWHGADDGIASLEGSRRLAEALIHGRFEAFEGARHEVHHERPDIVDRLFEGILDFLSEPAGQADAAGEGG